MSRPAAEIQVMDSGNCMAAPAVASKTSATPAAITRTAKATVTETSLIADSERTKGRAAAPAAGSQMRTDSQVTLSIQHEPEYEIAEETHDAERHRAAGQTDDAGVAALQE